jgi:hypothetical protein
MKGKIFNQQEVINFELVGDHIIQYYLSEGWEIVATAPNPYPCPYIFFSVRKIFDHKLSKEERRKFQDEAIKYNDEDQQF